jgi:hypothetical protein
MFMNGVSKLVEEADLSQYVGKGVFVCFPDRYRPILKGTVKRVSGGSHMDDRPEMVKVTDTKCGADSVQFTHRDVAQICDTGTGRPSIWLKEGVT